MSHLRRLGPDDSSEDLSALVVESIEREPGDRVECVRIVGSRYRCNWWSLESTAGYDNPKMKGGQIGSTHRIRKSRFLDVSRGPEGLRIEIVEDQDGPGDSPGEGR